MPLKARLPQLWTQRPPFEAWSSADAPWPQSGLCCSYCCRHQCRCCLPPEAAAAQSNPLLLHTDLQQYGPAVQFIPEVPVTSKSSMLNMHAPLGVPQA
jgi:hypothetical protein